MPIATMTSKGQITVPVEVREALGLGPGVQLDFEIVAGQLVAHKVIVIREQDRWMSHPDVVEALDRSASDLEEGRVSEPALIDEFLDQI